MTGERPKLEYATPRTRRPSHLSLYWHNYAPFAIMLIVVLGWVWLTFWSAFWR